MKHHFVMFAAYNRWANARLYDAAAALADADYRRDMGAFFGSIHGTLNHLLVADRIWMSRFTGAGDAPARLDVILYEEFGDLQAARQAEDQRILHYVSKLTDAALEAQFTYTPVTNPTPVTQRLSPALAHLFNHQTHHRGQAHAILSALRRNPPPLDLIYFQRTEEGAAFA